ncbi:hypothetical protein L3Q82_014755, partial [Scortum barcoo]
MYLEDVMKVLAEQGKVSTAGQASEKSVSLDVMKVLAEQGKVITELTKAVKDLTTQNQRPSTMAASKPRVLPKFTADGKPVCFRCQTEGHVAKQCPQKRHKDTESTPVESQQGNGNPWLQCRQLVTSEFDTVLGGTLDSGWRTAFQRMQTCTVEKKTLARIASRDKTKLDIGGTDNEHNALCALLAKYIDVFTDDDDDLGSTDKVKHEIKLVDDVPVTQPYRRIPPNQYKEVQEHISKLLKKGIIQESESSYASPVVVVWKSDGSIRLCVDYRKLNLKTKKDAFPLPRIDESFDALRGATYFSTIDLPVDIT